MSKINIKIIIIYKNSITNLELFDLIFKIIILLILDRTRLGSMQVNSWWMLSNMNKMYYGWKDI